MATLLHHELRNYLNDATLPNGLNLDIEVVVIPCVGSAGYAKRQMMALSAEVGASVKDIPTILRPSPGGETKQSFYFPFAQPKKVILDTFEMMRDKHDVLLDLVYGAPSWTIMMRHFDEELRPGLRYANTFCEECSWQIWL